MKIWVSSLARVHDVAATSGASHVISLLSPEDLFPSINGCDADRHHRVALHDIREPMEGLTAPNADHVGELVRFLSRWPAAEPLLVHCWAGISRSTAAAFIAACFHNPRADEFAIAAGLREASPTAWPNTRLVALADDLMRRGGRMNAAIESIGVGDIAYEAAPFSIPSSYAIMEAGNETV